MSLKTIRRGIYRLINDIKTPSSEKVNFDTYTVSKGHHKITYRGIPTLRCPFDYVMYQMIICDLKPDLVIEIGTNRGGTTLYIADILENLGNGVVHSMDLVSETTQLVKAHPRITLFEGGWQKYDISLAKSFSKILIIEDASHIYEDCIGALNKFNKLVTTGSYYIVEDGIINKLGQEKGFHGGPLRAIREFLEENSEFAIDREYCDMFGRNATFNVNGYLKRIK